VFHFDLFGKRDLKYDFLIDNNMKSINFKELNISGPHYFFIEKDLIVQKRYETGISLNDLFIKNTLGIQTHRDSFAISIDKSNLTSRISDFFNNEKSNQDLISKYKLKETSEWTLDKKRKGEFDPNLIVKIDYRFFDIRFVYYSNNIIDRDRKNIMQHLVQPNVALTVSKQQSSSAFRHIFISQNIQESCLISLQTKEGGYTFPLYLYPETNGQQTIGQSADRTPNLNTEIVKKIAEKLGLTFVPEKFTSSGGVSVGRGGSACLLLFSVLLHSSFSSDL